MVGFIGLNGLAEHTDSADDVECRGTSATWIGNGAVMGKIQFWNGTYVIFGIGDGALIQKLR
jgi:hypothetical protein